MNTYYKFCPNVFLAKCEEKHERSEEILVTTKYGKENESIVFNLILEKMVFIITPSSGLMVLTFKNGLSKERNADVNGLYRQNVKVKSTLTGLIKIEIFFHLVNLSRLVTIVKNVIEKQ